VRGQVEHDEGESVRRWERGEMGEMVAGCHVYAVKGDKMSFSATITRVGSARCPS
jgi:hypothetical protein